MKAKYYDHRVILDMTKNQKYTLLRYLKLLRDENFSKESRYNQLSHFICQIETACNRAEVLKMPQTPLRQHERIK